MTSLEVKARKECLFLILEALDALEGAASLSGEGRREESKSQEKQRTSFMDAPFLIFVFAPRT